VKYKSANKRHLAEQKGRRAEIIAAWYLRLKGYRILARRVRNPRGEIDIIVRRFVTTAFVEVKSRTKPEDLEQSISAYKMRRVVAAAEVEAHKYIRKNGALRFDVVLIAPWKWPKHLKNIHHEW